jgi:hypothetical protein
VTYEDDSGTILAIVYTLDDGQVRPKHVLITYMKMKISAAFEIMVTCMCKRQQQ